MSGVLVITGASRGIGAACARIGAGKGYSVAVNYVSNEQAAVGQDTIDIKYQQADP